MRHLKGVNLLLKVYPGPDNDWSFLKPAPRSLNESSLSIEEVPETVVAARELAASLRGWSDRKHELVEAPTLMEPPLYTERRF